MVLSHPIRISLLLSLDTAYLIEYSCTNRRGTDLTMLELLRSSSCGLSVTRNLSNCYWPGAV
jgi:hypothetical protein